MDEHEHHDTPQEEQAMRLALALHVALEQWCAKEPCAPAVIEAALYTLLASWVCHHGRQYGMAPEAIGVRAIQVCQALLAETERVLLAHTERRGG